MTDIREQARLAYDRTLAQKNLRERMSSRMILAHAGGLWNCDQNLITMLTCYQNEESVVLLDIHDIPRKLIPSELLSAVKQRHQECLNEWLIEYHNLSRIRTVKDA